MLDENSFFQIIANGRYYAAKQGLPNPETYEQSIIWTEDKSLATAFTYKETTLYLKKFKELLGDSHEIEYKELPKE